MVGQNTGAPSHASRYGLAFERYIAPARLKPQLWRVVLGLLLTLAVYAGLMIALGWLVVRLAGPEGGYAKLAGFALGQTPWGMVGLLFSFAALGVGPMIAVRLLHGRSPATLFGRGARVVRGFALGVGVVAFVYVLANLLSLLLPGEPSLPGLPPLQWLAFLPLALVGVAIQTGAEELVFRGYLLQQLAARFRSPVIWLGLPSLLFACLHYEPELMGPNALPVVLGTGIFGLAAADLTARTGSLGLAWGLHFANNAVALLVLSSGDALQGLALRLSPVTQGSAEGLGLLIFDIVLILIIWGLCRFILRR